MILFKFKLAFFTSFQPNCVFLIILILKKSITADIMIYISNEMTVWAKCAMTLYS